jgi:hypothetical protein
MTVFTGYGAALVQQLSVGLCPTRERQLYVLTPCQENLPDYVKAQILTSFAADGS